MHEMAAKYIMSYGGKDKMIRIVQYAAKCLGYYITQGSPASEFGALCKTSAKSLSLHRKTFKAFRFVHDFKLVR